MGHGGSGLAEGGQSHRGSASSLRTRGGSCFSYGGFNRIRFEGFWDALCPNLSPVPRALPNYLQTLAGPGPVSTEIFLRPPKRPRAHAFHGPVASFEGPKVYPATKFAQVCQGMEALTTGHRLHFAGPFVPIPAAHALLERCLPSPKNWNPIRSI